MKNILGTAMGAAIDRRDGDSGVKPKLNSAGGTRRERELVSI